MCTVYDQRSSRTKKHFYRLLLQSGILVFHRFSKGTCSCYFSGGTADISVHENIQQGKLEEVHKASGGPWGGTYVDKAYTMFLEKIFGKEALEELKNSEMSEYFDILREFETKKRLFSETGVDMIMLRISSGLRNLSQKHKQRSLQECIESCGFGDKVVIRGQDKLRIHPSIVQQWFDDPVDKVISHVSNLLSKQEICTVKSILLVGGFSESRYVQERFKKTCEGKTLIVPAEPGLAVVKGAVKFGHDPSIVKSRIMIHSYGIACNVPFQKGVHPAWTMVRRNGEERFPYLFSSFVRANESVQFEQDLTQTYGTHKHTTGTAITVYRSENTCPLFTTDDGCEKLGCLIISHKLDETFHLTFIFGDTELKVRVRLASTGEEFYKNINCLE